MVFWVAFSFGVGMGIALTILFITFLRPWEFDTKEEHPHKHTKEEGSNG